MILRDIKTLGNKMIHTIQSKEYGIIEVNEKKRNIYFYQDDMEYQIDEDNMFFDYYGRLWEIEFVDSEIILKVRDWVEAGRTKK